MTDKLIEFDVDLLKQDLKAIGAEYDSGNTALEYISTLEQRAARLELALRLMLSTPEVRLGYCKEHGLLPPEVTASESVDKYWRKQIAEEALTKEKA